ncbi:MAG: glycosyltransferase family 39 protein [Pseudorhodoplanes sp.]|nr:glycosyltransferase family 39 protein [Pseudorhodoplanes sp.]
MPGLQERVYDYACGILVAGLLLLVTLTFRHYGISNDEEVQHRYGELIVAYYGSGFADRALFDYKNLYLYGGLFDVVAVLLAKLVPLDVYLLRHLLSGVIGVAGIGVAALTARLIAGARAGLIAALVLAACGPWFGAMFNHTKDIPFAAAMMGAVYFLLRMSRDLPAARWGDVIGFGLMLGAATGLRAIGLLLVGYAGIAVALAMPWTNWRSANGIRAAALFAWRSGLRLMPAFLIGYLIMIAAWPWAAQAPLNPLRAIFSFAHFHYEIRTIVAGNIYKMADVPWWYVPFYLAIKSPLLILSGAACAIAFACRPPHKSADDTDRRRRVDIAFVAFVAIFPVICEVATEGPAFTGMRHFLFVIPPLAVLSGVGFDVLLRFFRPWRWAKGMAVAALAAALTWNVSLLVRLHPYEYMFYNTLIGGLQGAERRYEMDYWVNMMPEAVGALENYLNLRTEKSQRTYTVGVCGETFSFQNYADKRLRASSGWLEADFYIAPTHMNCDRLVDGRVIATIERMGVTIGVVKDRRGFTQKALGRAF